MCTDIFQTRMSWLTCLFWHSTTMFKDILQTRMPWLHLKTSSRQGCHDQHVYFDTPQLHLKMIFQTRMSWLTRLFWHSTTTFKDDLPDKDVMTKHIYFDTPQPLILCTSRQGCFEYHAYFTTDVCNVHAQTSRQGCRNKHAYFETTQLTFVMCIHRPPMTGMLTSWLACLLWLSTAMFVLHTENSPQRECSDNVQSWYFDKPDNPWHECHD